MRTLPLCPYTQNYLTMIWNAQQQQRTLCENCYDTRYLDFVCVDQLGTLIQPDYVTGKFAQILNKYGLRPIRFHDPRHSCATIMLYLGCSLKDIQTWLGHSNYNFTADTYIHSGMGAHEQMALSMSERLGELLPQNIAPASIDKDSADEIALALGMKPEKVFTFQENERTLSPKTILEHHRLISTVLDQAEKEGLVPFNVAAKATLPKVTKKEVNYFQPEQVAAIRDALEEEPIKWRVLTHLFLITGARRGELLGLKWDKVDFKENRIYICNNVVYTPDRGIYEDTPKTDTSKRFITLPAETMQLLQQYKAWQSSERLRIGEYYHDQGFVFTQDDGNPMHPDSVTGWMSKFSKRRGLPHINPHAFRHTMASILYFNSADSVSISKRLGHAQVSTTVNIYAHVIEAADQKNTDILADAFLKKA